MARRFAQVPVMIWGRDSFRSLSGDAQRLYLLLGTSPTTGMAGVADWRPKRVASLSSDGHEEELTLALDELVEAGVAELDADTEEVWLKPMIVDDGLLRGPKTASGVASAWSVVGSQRLRESIAEHVRGLVAEGVTPAAESILRPLMEYGLKAVAKPRRVPVPPERAKVKSSRFDEWWDAYPKQESKLGARKSYDRAVAAGITEQILIDGAIKYSVVRHGQDPKYTKQPTTWLNQGCWDDETEAITHGDATNPGNWWDQK